MHPSKIFYLVIIFFLFSSSCQKDKITDPPIKDSVITSKRDFVWTIDTLDYSPYPLSTANTIIYAMWGANDSTLFAVGRDEFGGVSSMWKFNGKKWERAKLSVSEGGTFTKAFAFYDVYGFSEKDINAFGYFIYSNQNPPPNFLTSAMAAHYDGTQWNALAVPAGEVMYRTDAYAANNFYVGGTNGQLFHFIDGLWIVDTIRFSQFPDMPFYNVDVISCSQNGVYLITTQYNSSTGIVFYQTLLHDESGTILIDSTNSLSAKWGLDFYWKSHQGTIFSAGSNGIFKLTGVKWVNILSTEGFISLSGTNDNDIFAFGYSGNVHHYNGKDWSVIFTVDISTYPVRGNIAWCDDKNIFISVYYNRRSIIFHGQNKEDESR